MFTALVTSLEEKDECCSCNLIMRDVPTRERCCNPLHGVSHRYYEQTIIKATIPDREDTRYQSMLRSHPVSLELGQSINSLSENADWTLVY